MHYFSTASAPFVFLPPCFSLSDHQHLFPLPLHPPSAQVARDADVHRVIARTPKYIPPLPSTHADSSGGAGGGVSGNRIHPLPPPFGDPVVGGGAVGIDVGGSKMRDRRKSEFQSLVAQAKAAAPLLPTASSSGSGSLTLTPSIAIVAPFGGGVGENDYYNSSAQRGVSFASTAFPTGNASIVDGEEVRLEASVVVVEKGNNNGRGSPLDNFNLKEADAAVLAAHGHQSWYRADEAEQASLDPDRAAGTRCPSAGSTSTLKDSSSSRKLFPPTGNAGSAACGANAVSFAEVVARLSATEWEVTALREQAARDAAATREQLDVLLAAVQSLAVAGEY